MLKRLVFADDFSAGADAAWLWVTQHPWPGWEIEVITATPDDAAAEPRADATGPQPWDPPIARTPLGPAAGTPVVHERIPADPRRALGACCDRDLLVIGPRGKGLLKSLHLGSTAEALIHDPPMPMVIARNGRPTRRVVVCADGSEHSRTAKAALLQMPWAADVDVLVVSVPERGFDARAVADSAAQTLAGGVASVKTHVPELDDLQVFYHPRDIILEVLDSWQADLVVLGSRGLSRWEALRAGSIATSLTAHAPCTVLLAPESLHR